MSTQSEGRCKYCGKEYTRGSMLRHLAACKERKARLAAEVGSKKYNYFELSVSGRPNNNYWLIIEIREDATLKDLDTFLRDIWLECCGHLSAFTIDDVRYNSIPSDDPEWGPPGKSMIYKLRPLLRKGMKIAYEYDLGSTTKLVIGVHDYRVSGPGKETVTVLSRNNPPEIICNTCHKKKAVVVCNQCACEYRGFLCNDCRKTHKCRKELLHNICNSPRVGICVYEGSDLYPDQFVPDKEI